MSKVEHSTESNCKWNEQANAFARTQRNTISTRWKVGGPRNWRTIANSSSPGKRDEMDWRVNIQWFSISFQRQSKADIVDGYSRWRWKLGRIFRLDDTWTYTTRVFFFVKFFHLILSVLNTDTQMFLCSTSFAPHWTLPCCCSGCLHNSSSCSSCSSYSCDDHWLIFLESNHVGKQDNSTKQIPTRYWARNTHMWRHFQLTTNRYSKFPFFFNFLYLLLRFFVSIFLLSYLLLLLLFFALVCLALLWFEIFFLFVPTTLNPATVQLQLTPLPQMHSYMSELQSTKQLKEHNNNNNSTALFFLVLLLALMGTDDIIQHHLVVISFDSTALHWTEKRNLNHSFFANRFVKCRIDDLGGAIFKKIILKNV